MQDKNQGEGNYEAARQFQKSQHEFAQSGRVEDKARDAFAAHLNSLFGADVELAQPHDVREVS